MNTPALNKASWLALATVALSACSAGQGDPGALGNGAAGGGNAPGSGGVFYGSGGTTGSGGSLTSTGGDNFGSFTSKGGSGGKSTDECISVNEEAEKILGGKADIIWAVDTSGSMLTEVTAVQANLNTFSQFITSTGIDVHVIMVAVAGLTIPNPFDPAAPPLQLGICVAPPLGSGKACPEDTSPPRYTHVLQEVGSNDALSIWMSTYPQWQSAIRPDSTKTFVIVSDDEAHNVTAAEFRAFFDNAFAGSKWRYSGIFCKTEGGNCAGAGVIHDQLVQETGGIWADMGNPNPDWTAVFKQLSDAVVADAKPVDCEWKIPPAPTGQTFDKKKVNVDFTPTSGVKETIFKVTKESCQDPAGGWYYDNEEAPTTVLACPQSCTKIQSDNNAKIAIAFGCESKRPIM